MPCPISCRRTNKLGSVRCVLQLCHICHTACHPEHTPNSLRFLNLKGVKRPGTAAAQRKKFEKLRNKKFKNHSLVTVETPERAAKKRGCRNLMNKQPKHAANLAAGVGKSFDQITAIFAKNSSPARFVHQSISPDSWTPDLTEHGDIHHNPGPTDRSFKLWSCNCGRGTGSWEAFALAMSEKVDVLALQEDALTPTERESFVRYVTKNNYRIFEGCSRMRNKRAWGGA